MTEVRTRRAKEFLRRAMPLGDATLESTHGAPTLEMAMPRPEAIPDEHRGAVESAARKSMTDEPLTPNEQFALEAIIIPDKRPAVDVVNGDFVVTHPLWTRFSTDAAIHARLKDALPSIGRIELPTNPSVPYGGTGFVVGKDLLMTNRHVAEIFASGLGVRTLSFRPGSAAVDFKREKGSPELEPDRRSRRHHDPPLLGHGAPAGRRFERTSPARAFARAPGRCGWARDCGRRLPRV